MPFTVKQAECVNCHVDTPANNNTCVHCGKPRSIKVPVSILVTKANPTEADLADYRLWLSHERS